MMLKSLTLWIGSEKVVADVGDEGLQRRVAIAIDQLGSYFRMAWVVPLIASLSVPLRD